MVYHSQLDTTDCDFACGFPLVPVRSKGRSEAGTELQRDIVDETLYAFRANILFRNFEVKGAADKLLIYLTLYVNLCLKRESRLVVVTASRCVTSHFSCQFGKTVLDRRYCRCTSGQVSCCKFSLSACS